MGEEKQIIPSRPKFIMHRNYTLEEIGIIEHWKKTKYYKKLWDIITNNGELFTKAGKSEFLFSISDKNETFISVLPKWIKKNKPEEQVIDDIWRGLPPIRSSKASGFFDMTEWRDKEMEKDKKNKAHKRLRDLLFRLHLPIIEEYTLPITNKTLWKDLCNKVFTSSKYKDAMKIEDINHKLRKDANSFYSNMYCKITADGKNNKDYKKFFNKSFMSLDNFSYLLGLNIEHDGTIYHNVFEDMVRDEYLKQELNLNYIKRVVDYTENKELKYRTDFENIINNNSEPAFKQPDNWGFVVNFLNEFVLKYNEELTLIEIFVDNKKLTTDYIFKNGCETNNKGLEENIKKLCYYLKGI